MTLVGWSGRSRHGSKPLRRKTTPVRHKTPKPGDDELAAPKPDLDELRRKRLSYLTASPEARRRIAATVDKPKNGESTASPSKTTSGEQRRRRRKHKSSTSSSTKPVKSSASHRTRTEDYVYRTAPSSDPKDATAERVTAVSQRQKRPGSSTRRHSLPTVVESDITPDDSISQVAERPSPDLLRHKSSSRTSLQRRSTSSKLPPITEKDSDAKSAATSSRRSSKHQSSSSLLGLGSLLRRNTAPAIPTPPRLVECLTCAADDVPATQSAKLACGHRMCHDCLKRLFEMSVKDPQHMPPKCCTADHIPLKHAEKLFDLKFKIAWNRKFQEYHTKNRIYCPAPKCGEWIRPSHIHSHQGRKYAQCPRCNTKVCTLCNAKLHKAKECPEDPEIAKLVEQAKEKGWKTCYNCHAMVELKEGCNHMTCRCRAEFCMICAKQWKTCDCPWFNYTQMPDADRLNEWRVPEPIPVIHRRVARPPPPLPRMMPPRPDQNPPNPAPAPAPAQAPRRRQLTYTEEVEERRRQERLDEDLARRLQLASLLEPDNDQPGTRRADVETWGLGNAAGHFMNEDFVSNAANVIMDAFGDPAMGRRGDRASARRRRPRNRPQEADTGLPSNFLGDESVVGVPASGPRASGQQTLLDR